jgi:hypothetical protein
MSTNQRNDARTLAVAPHLVDLLRQQTLAVLEFNHHPFEDYRELPTVEQLTAAAIFRDGFAVLDAIGWSAEADGLSIDVRLTVGHVSQLRACLVDAKATIQDAIIYRQTLTSVADVDDLDDEIDQHRVAVRHLEKILALWDHTSD